ncbi:SIR2 family protein [Vibrio parahaemolyticus]|uniref:SIR2 family protein n=1 Tax=Vibrio harveyi group TaxID=717610 RepID=UPI0006A77509|nr:MULTISPECIES: SIR2 family protein [Vibrio harveyi group]EKK9986822.1 SIR2 family protein [Vibrio vulnificus]EGR0299505.1 SIR2 family protein [Vibrio parahaemolyticus]MBM4915358.1 SIR2 family protein [Vibrio parahaemolyticus]TOM02773.1 SIR2 family protein [Vibrio parahaemolyticus]HAS6427886.1 SIR2 family protein [Vibrio parahaemolyticus]
MKNDNIIRFLSSDLKMDSVSLKREPNNIDLNSDDLDEKLASFYRFINKVLDTDNLVILAGSGTSLTFNHPSQHEQDPIAPSMWHLWEYCYREDESLFELVLKATNYDALQKHRENDGSAKPDIELLLSLCDSSLAVGNLSNQRVSQVSRFLEQAKKIILSRTSFTEMIPESDWVSHDKFMRAVGRRSAQQQRLKLFTTNYDLAFEQAASNTGFVVIDGFEFSNPSYFNPMWFKYDIVNRGHSQNSEGAYIPNVIQLYKMHGSVDWRKINGRVRKLSSDSPKGDPVFIYPSSSKYQTSYDSPYLDMMTSFLELVKHPKTAVLCIGFGFNDKHINNALTMALRTNPEFMLMVATKDPFDITGSFNAEIRDLLTAAIDHGDGRIALVDSTFEQFSRLLPERRSTTPEDELFKAFEKIAASIK